METTRDAGQGPYVPNPRRNGVDEGSEVSADFVLADPTSASSSTIPKLGDFRILREIGRGGMGVVFEAVQESLGRRVALKILPPHALHGETQARRFELEARSAGRLHHTNIVPVFGAGHEAGVHFYVMQFIEGRSLDHVIEDLKRPRADSTDDDAAEDELGTHQIDAAAITDSGPLNRARSVPGRTGGVLPSTDFGLPPAPEPPLSQESTGRSHWRGSARVALQAAEALVYAHKKGILHRDIKPSNLLLDPTGNVWVTDFGLAKAADSDDLTHSGDLVGTLRYMAPERFEGQSDARSDVYALGLTLYELLALRPAFDAAERTRLVSQVMHHDPPRLRKVVRPIPRDLETIVHTAIARDPDRRYPSAAAMAADLRRFLDDRPIQARRAGPLERSTRWVRRNPDLAGLAALLISALIAGSAFSAAFGFRALRMERLAEQKADDARQAASKAIEEREWSRRLLYDAEMNLVQRDFESSHLAEARRRLRELRPSPGELDPRGFEWDYWDAACRAELRILEADGQAIHALGASPDGRTLALGAVDGTIRFVGIADGRERSRLTDRTGAWGPFAISPDGRLVASWSDDEGVSLRDAATGRDREIPGGRLPRPWGLAFSPDSRLLAVAGVDQVARIRDLASGSERAFPAGDLGATLRVAFSSDGRLLAVSGIDVARIWEVADGRPGAEFRGQSGSIHGLAFSPDGRALATAGVDSTARLWEVASGRELMAFRGHQGRVQGLAISPDGRLLATVGEDRTARLWDTLKGRERAVLRGHEGAVVSVAFCGEGRLLATAGTDRTVRLWDAPGGVLADLRGRAAVTSSVAFAPGGRTLVAGGSGPSIRLLEVETGRLLATFPERGNVERLAVTPDGRRIAVASDRVIRLLDAATLRQVASFPISPGADRAIAFSPDSGRLAGPGPDGFLRLWEAETGREIAAPGGPKFRAIAFGPDGKFLATAGDDGIRVRGAADGRERSVLGQGDGPTHSLAFSPDGRTLASGGVDRLIRLRDVASGQLLGTFRGQDALVEHIAFHPGGDRLASAGQDGATRIWDVRTAREVAALRGVDGQVRAIAFSPDGLRLAAAGPFTNAVLRLWDASGARRVPEARREAIGLAWFRIDEARTIDEFRDRIARDPTAPDAVRTIALDLVNPLWESRCLRLADAIVKEAFARSLSRVEATQIVLGDPRLGPDSRPIALRLAADYPENAQTLNKASWAIVRAPGRSREDYARALELAERAVRAAPEEGIYLNTLGAAQFRLGQDPEALDSLTRSDRMNHGHQPDDLAFLALVLTRLGRLDDARDQLGRLQARLNRPGRPVSPQTRGVIFEARQSFLDAIFPRDPFARARGIDR